jgi:hypothetical protein
MLIAAPHLPKALWPYAARYTVELLNHYPTTTVPCGKTPPQMLLKHMKVVNPVPSLHSVRTFVEPGYVHTPVQKRVQSAKFQPCATKMYFVGREGSRICHMWEAQRARSTAAAASYRLSMSLLSFRKLLATSLPRPRATSFPRPGAMIYLIHSITLSRYLSQLSNFHLPRHIH